MSEVLSSGFQPPPYPYDRLDDLRSVAAQHTGGVVDLSVGTPTDPPPSAAVEALGSSGSERGYPPSIGTAEFREACKGWLGRRLGVEVPTESIAACIGTKEVVASLPQLLRLRTPHRDTVLFPEVSYPTYEMGAILAGCRAVPVAVDDEWAIDVGSISDADASRALCLWVNTPGNPAGGLDDLEAVAEWGRLNGVPILSDECYVEFTWDGPPRTILSHGTSGVVAVHSLSKRSNLAGLRAGFYAGDEGLVRYLSEVRKHAGAMVPGPVQAAAAAAFSDDEHVDRQRERYAERLGRLAALLEAVGLEVAMPRGAFYLWVPAPDGDAWGAARRLAVDLGMLVSPGEFYGPRGNGYIRVAAVCQDQSLSLLESRL